MARLLWFSHYSLIYCLFFLSSSCIKEGKKESDVVPLREILAVAKVSDEINKLVGSKIYLGEEEGKVEEGGEPNAE